MTTTLLEDVSLLTDVSETTLKKFIPIITYAIGHAVHEADCLQKQVLELDVGIGEIHIKLEDTAVKFKFIPSKELEKMLVNTLVTHTSPIITRTESKLQEKIERTYKELL